MKTNLVQKDHRRSLAQMIMNKAFLSGQFKLRSGRVSNLYIDKYAVFSHPQLLDTITRYMASLVPPSVQIIAGREMGTIPLSIMLSQHTGLECAFIRKEAKKYGTQRVVEGVDIKGKNVLVLENIATSGGEVMTTTRKLRALGAVVTHALVVVDQEEGGLELTGIGGVSLLSLLKKSDFDGLSPEK